MHYNTTQLLQPQYKIIFQIEAHQIVLKSVIKHG
jgi:hypothetical protein